MRQVCCHRKLVLESASNHSSKLDRALEIVQNLHQNKRKVLVFSQFVRLLKLFREQLLKANMEFCYLDEALFKSTQAEDEIDRFQNTDVSIPDLSKSWWKWYQFNECDRSNSSRSWWNPAVEDQASDRAHRIGQTQTVTVIRLVAERLYRDTNIASSGGEAQNRSRPFIRLCIKNYHWKELHNYWNEVPVGCVTVYKR